MTDLQKYLLFFKFEEAEGLLIWGADLSFDSEDYFLIDERKNILLFKSKIEISEFISNEKNYPIIFDKENMIKWNNLISSIRIAGEFDLNILSTDFISGIDKVRAYALIDVFNYIMDYAIQTSDQKLLDILKGRILENLNDYLYDNFFWKSSENDYQPLTSSNELIYSEVKRLLNLFILRIRVV